MDLEEKELTYPVGEEQERLDVFVSRSMTGITRSAVRRLIDTGFITVNGKPGKPSLKLKGGELISVRVPPPLPAVPVAEKIPLEILYEDEDIVVVNKAAGMVVHPGAGNRGGTLVNALLGHCRDLSGIGGEIRPGIVHRIDKDTTGILVVAKNDDAHRSLACQFKQHSVRRVYTALVYGSPGEDKGVIEAAIGRHPTDRKKMSGATRRGRHAITNWRVTGRYSGITLMTITLETGRTHQIRVHFSEAGFPLLGDPVYGGSGRLANLKDPELRKMIKELGRQALHAGTLGIIHPTSGEYLEFNADMPEDMSEIIKYLEKAVNMRNVPPHEE